MGWVVVGGISGLIAVAAGAFGAHGLRDSLSPEQMTWFELASRYQLIHALALAVAGMLTDTAKSRRAASWAGWAFAIGTLVFSGSLYAMALSGVRWLGAITPIGGVSLLLGWALLAWAGVRRRS